MTKRTYADPTSKRRSVTVNDENWRVLKAIGNGNASEGIRILTNLYTSEAGHKPQ